MELEFISRLLLLKGGLLLHSESAALMTSTSQLLLNYYIATTNAEQTPAPPVWIKWLMVREVLSVDGSQPKGFAKPNNMHRKLPE